jgi:hypothetical protein
MWCIDKLLPRSGYRFLPVGSRNLAARGISPKVLLLSRCPFEHVARRGDGVAHTRMREARINIMLIMRKRNPLKTIG